MFLHDASTPEIYTLSLHDALPISSNRLLPGAGRSLIQRARCGSKARGSLGRPGSRRYMRRALGRNVLAWSRSEEHTSELQSHSDLVCRLLLEKKKKTQGN